MISVGLEAILFGGKNVLEEYNFLCLWKIYRME